MQNMSSDRVCTSKVHLVCMWDAWAIHEQSTHGANCVNHTINDQNMINMNNYGWSPKIGTHWSPKEWKNIIKAFYQTLKMHTLYMYVKQCMNIWKSCLNTYYFSLQGANIQSKSSFKTKPKVKFSNPHLRKSQL